jgi:serine/threonine protein kinase
MPAARPALAAGEMLEGKYQIARELGRGAMGIVYEALHVSLGRRVAVKTLIEGTAADTELGARFEREARAASAIGHPHIIDVFDLGRTKDGLLFMVMELLDGRPLEAMLGKTPMLPIPLAINLMSQVLGGLGAAHKNGIVHRDLKPDNIFVINTEERPNFVKIVDFGISKVLGPKAGGQVAPGQFTGTMVGTVMGTPLYMSPEQAIGQVTAIDHRTDIYSAGVVLYQMLCGQTPFAGKSYPEVLGKILEGKYRKPSELRPDIPPQVEAAIVRAMARDIEARFPTAAAMRAEISAGQAEITPGPVRLAAPTGRAPAELPPLGSPPLVDGEPIRLLDATTAPRPSAKRAVKPGADPFAPPPETDMTPLLGDGLDLDRSVAVRPGPAVRPRPEPERLELAPSRLHERPVATRERTMAPAETGPRKRSWPYVAFGLLVVAGVASLALGVFGPADKSSL